MTPGSDAYKSVDEFNSIIIFLLVSFYTFTYSNTCKIADEFYVIFEFPAKVGKFNI